MTAKPKLRTRWHLWVALVVFGGCGVIGDPCSSSENCPANRPRDSRGCCPRFLGELCGLSEPGACDTQLGYYCQVESSSQAGVCTGAYNLHATSIEQNKASLEWNDFKPDNYTLEYSLLFTDQTYKRNVSDWTAFEIGSSPRYELRHVLQPNTQYFVRIGVWGDIFEGIYANLTETLVFKTKPVEYCEYNNISYNVGQVFTHNCEDNCTCLPSGKFNCLPLCVLPVIGEADLNRCKRERVNESCCSWQIVCQPIASDCVDPELELDYSHGDEFQLTECETCTCDNGSISCQYSSMCARPSAACAKPEAVRVEGKCCPNWTCSLDCEKDGETFQNGESWRKESTCEQCNCEEGHIACHSQCEEPTIPEDCSMPRLKPRSGSCCLEYQCSAEGENCYYENQLHDHGTYFSNKDCELCACADNNTVDCTPIQCPDHYLPQYDVFCQTPNIRKDGCKCDTLWCSDKEHLTDMITNLYGTSYSPDSVTLSFMETVESTTGDVDEEIDEEHDGTTKKYELQYFSSSMDNTTETWRKKVFEPQQATSQDEPVKSPTQFLRTTGAIRVGNRVYITLSGMQANTTYYLKVAVVTHAFHDSTGEVTSTPPQYAGAIVVRTLSEDLQPNCPSSCESDDVILIPSVSCPRPVLFKSVDACCPTWKCYPTAGGCHYGDIILNNGENFHEGCDQKCVCRDGNVICSPVCESPGDSPRDGCRLDSLQGHCCKVWMCPPKVEPVQSMSVTITVKYAGTCNQNMDNFESEFKKSVLSILKFSKECVVNSPDECDTAMVNLICPFISERFRRQTSFLTVDIFMKTNVSSRSLDAVNSSFSNLITSLTNVFQTDNATINIQGSIYAVEESVIVTPINADCPFGFIYSNYSCVQGVMPDNSPETLDVPLRISSTSNSAVLAWKSFRTPKTRYVTGLQIEYREDVVEQMFSWNQSDPLDPSVTSHELTSLHAARGYKARLVIFTNIIENNRVRLSPVRFETKPFTREILKVDIHFHDVRISKTNVALKWTMLSESTMKNVVAVEIRYCRAGANVPDFSGLNFKHRQALKVSSTSVTISNLLQGTAYSAQLTFMFRNKSMATSGTIHFVTMGIEGGPEHLLVPLLVSAAVVVCAVLVVLITCYMWRRSRPRSERETAFENKTFGLHIENDGRTLNVAP